VRETSLLRRSEWLQPHNSEAAEDLPPGRGIHSPLTNLESIGYSSDWIPAKQLRFWLDYGWDVGE